MWWLVKLWLMPVGYVFALPLQNTCLCCNYGKKRKKKKKCDLLHTLTNKPIASCEIWNIDKNPLLKKEVNPHGKKSKWINVHFIKIGMVFTTLKCDVYTGLGACYQVDLKTKQGSFLLILRSFGPSSVNSNWNFGSQSDGLIWFLKRFTKYIFPRLNWH